MVITFMTNKIFVELLIPNEKLQIKNNYDYYKHVSCLFLKFNIITEFDCIKGCLSM